MLLTAADLLMASSLGNKAVAYFIQLAGRLWRAFVLCFVPHVSGRVPSYQAPFSQVAVVTDPVVSRAHISALILCRLIDEPGHLIGSSTKKWLYPPILSARCARGVPL